MASAFGNNVWQIVALVIGIIILMFGVGRGIEKANKIMMPVFFILCCTGIYVAFQPGAIEATNTFSELTLRHLLTLRHGYSLLARHSFSFLLLVMALLYMVLTFSDNEDIPAAAGRVALFDTIAHAFWQRLVIIPAMATTGAQLNQGWSRTYVLSSSRHFLNQCLADT